MEEHAVESGKMIAKMNASYVSFLTLMLDPIAPLYKDWKEGRFKLLGPEEVLQEAAMMLDYARPEKKCVFRSNHASNYVSLKGDLPYDNDRMIDALKRCMKDKSLIKEEYFRRL